MKKEKEVVEEEKMEEADAFDQMADLSQVEEVEEEVMAAYAKHPCTQLTVTKETILAAIDRGDADYLRAHCRTTKNTGNKLFANTRDSFTTAEKNAAGKKRLVSVTVLARAIYLFPAAPTREAASAHCAIMHVLLTHCGFMVSREKERAG